MSNFDFESLLFGVVLTLVVGAVVFGAYLEGGRDTLNQVELRNDNVCL